MGMRREMSAIKDIQARKIYDSRGNPTLEVDIYLASGVRGRASVPSGASTGKSETLKLQDMVQSINNVAILKNSLVGQDAAEQEKNDLLMINTDGTKQKKNLGGNVILAVSLAMCDAAAKEANLPLYQYIHSISGINFDNYSLPTPLFNIVNGGKHADSNLPFQEFMIVPMVNGTFAQKLDMGVMVFQHLKQHLKQMNLSTNVGDEGGFAPALNSNEEAMEVIVDAIQDTGLTPGKDVSLALDVAASAVADLNAVTYPLPPIAYYEKILTEYPIALIEDPLGEDDWQGWQKITEQLGNKIKIVGDDIFTTNPELFAKGIEMHVANSVLIKPDQIGTLTETLRTIRLARDNKYNVVISHRSGETESTFIADLAVGVGADFIKSGAPSRGERVAKYNQLLRIEEEILKRQ